MSEHVPPHSALRAFRSFVARACPIMMAPSCNLGISVAANGATTMVQNAPGGAYNMPSAI
eukprot:7484760-Alexandrium_andersonii.AAC.1